MNAEDKLKDFQKRLLSVNMDKEDAAAMSQSTAGENAYKQPDFSESQKLLESILQKINEETTTTQDSQSMSALDLSTSSGVGDIFDSVDSMMGSETTLMEGDQLYRAALPICQDIANEACDADDARIVQSAYQMSIEQDCDTLAKNYDTLMVEALGGVREGSALLDMSRLTNNQTRNSGTILSCTKAMMEIINTDSVCGKDLGKCLDWKGEYIDPLTGNAILTGNLANLSNLLVKPKNGEKWATVVGNDGMIKFLESKKMYIEPAMETCESIRDVVWGNFIEEALAKIKLAQNQKLEEMRQNCTTLVGECKTTTNKSIEDFDSRALSIFGIAADTTVNKMCVDVQDACNALMKAMEPVKTDENAPDWVSSMNEIDLEKTYEAVKQNCKLVGEECIKRQCQTRESQFGLCLYNEDKQRKNILRNPYQSVYFSNACFDEVVDCIKQIPKENLEVIANKHKLRDSVVGIDKDGTSMNVDEVFGYHIWGYCQSDLNKSTDPNKQFINITKQGTLLKWFSESTGNDECVTNMCSTETGDYETYADYGYINTGAWKSACTRQGTSAYEKCSNNSYFKVHPFEDLPANLSTSFYKTDEGIKYFTNCCSSGEEDAFGNCCEKLPSGSNNNFLNLFPMSNKYFKSEVRVNDNKCDSTIACCLPADPDLPDSPENAYCGPEGFNNTNWTYVATNNETNENQAISRTTHLFCMGGFDKNSYYCNGSYVTVDSNGIYRSRLDNSDTEDDRGGIERYLNFFYGNKNDDPGDSSRHHMLYIYLPNGFQFKLSNNTFATATAVSGDNYYRIFATSGVTANSLTINTELYKNGNLELSTLKHRVAYCEYGFKIFAIGGYNAFNCCPSEARCPTYQIVSE